MRQTGAVGSAESTAQRKDFQSRTSSLFLSSALAIVLSEYGQVDEGEVLTKSLDLSTEAPRSLSVGDGKEELVAVLGRGGEFDLAVGWNSSA